MAVAFVLASSSRGRMRFNWAGLPYQTEERISGVTSNISRVGDFGIEGDADDLQLVLLSNAGDELARYRLTPEIVYKLVTEIPKYANQLANGGVVDDSNSSNGQRQNWVSGRFAVPTKILHPRK